MREELDQKGVEELCAAVIRQAYVELLSARLYDAQMRFREVSYNCNKRYHEFHRENKCRVYNKMCLPDDKHQHESAIRYIERLESWFLTSKRFELFARNSDGTWFVRMAKRKVEAFVLDEIMEMMVMPNEIDKNDHKYIDKRRRWKRERNAWRKEHKLKEVKDE